MRQLRFHYKVFLLFLLILALLLMASGIVFFKVTISVLEYYCIAASNLFPSCGVVLRSA